MGKVYLFLDQNGAKTLPDWAAHTYMAYIREHPPGHLVTSPNKSSTTVLHETRGSYMHQTNDCWDWNVDMC